MAHWGGPTLHDCHAAQVVVPTSAGSNIPRAHLKQLERVPGRAERFPAWGTCRGILPGCGATAPFALGRPEGTPPSWPLVCGGGGGGFWDLPLCAPKMARSNFSLLKILVVEGGCAIKLGGGVGAWLCLKGVSRGGGGSLGPKNLCTKNGLTRFSQL